MTREENGIITPGNWKQDGQNNLWPLQHLAGNQTGIKIAKDQRELMAEKMLTDQLAPWQFQNALCSV